MQQRAFLFLQGVCSPFFYRLGKRLRALGLAVHKVHFNVGDVAYWGFNGARSFRGPLEGLPDFMADCHRRWGITDQVLFGDCRPVHRPAITAAQVRGIRNHIFEEGYFRPHWVTLEREGVNGHSLLPRDPDWFVEAAQRLPQTTTAEPVRSPFWIRALHDVVYHSASAWNPLFFPRYRTHAPFNAAVEYAAYCRQLPRLRLIARREARRCQAVLQASRPFFLLPLQLNSDAQILTHSRFDGMASVMETVIASFAAHAPSEAHLVIKNHPLDVGLVDYPAVIAGLTHRFGLDAERIVYLEGGSLPALCDRARGVITVNSTSGLVAIQHGCPVKTLADPIYNLPGLTFQGDLDDFWHSAEPPDGRLYGHFHDVVHHTTQINGSFYSSRGITVAIENALPHLAADRSPLERLL